MRKSRFPEEHIIGMLREPQASPPVAKLCRKHGGDQRGDALHLAVEAWRLWKKKTASRKRRRKGRTSTDGRHVAAWASYVGTAWVWEQPRGIHN